MWAAFDYFPFRWLAKCILFLTGWSPMSKSIIAKMERLDRAIFIFPHSSNWDFAMASLYAIAEPKVYKDIYAVVKPQPFETCLGPFLKSAGLIPATRREDSNAGFVPNVIKVLEKKKRFHLLISPRGSRDGKEWKSGYYWIARQMKIPIVVVGYDFEYQIPVVDRVFYIDHYDTKENLEKDLKRTAGRIIPLHDKKSCLPLRSHRTPRLANWYKLFCYLYMITTIITTSLAIFKSSNCNC